VAYHCTPPLPAATGGYDAVLSGMVALLQAARRASARTVNAIMTATYWEIGRRIAEFEQGGSRRAGYGEQLLARLSADLAARFGRGIGYAQVRMMRQFFLSIPQIRQSVIGELQPGSSPPQIGQSVIGESSPDLHKRLLRLAHCFPLSWTHYRRPPLLVPEQILNRTMKTPTQPIK
jgi:hypothetical protein